MLAISIQVRNECNSLPYHRHAPLHNKKRKIITIHTPMGRLLACELGVYKPRITGTAYYLLFQCLYCKVKNVLYNINMGL